LRLGSVFLQKRKKRKALTASSLPRAVTASIVIATSCFLDETKREANQPLKLIWPEAEEV
jgi:hypothetical protein